VFKEGMEEYRCPATTVSTSSHRIGVLCSIQNSHGKIENVQRLCSLLSASCPLVLGLTCNWGWLGADASERINEALFVFL
jgi:hypothetical protein